MIKRILSMLLVVMMLVGMLPTGVFAAEVPHTHEALTVGPEQSAVQPQSEDETPQTIPVEITMNTIASTAKLYSWVDGSKGETDLLAGVLPQSNVYKTSLEAGSYLLEGYSGDGFQFYGSIVLSVSENSNAFTVYTVSGLKVTNEGWVNGTDYTITARVMSKDMSQDRQAVLGSDGTNATLLCLYMDSVSLTYTPDATLHEGYGAKTRTETIYSNTGGLTVTLEPLKTVTVNAPADSTIQIVDGGTYYDYTIYEPVSETKTDDGVSAVFTIADGNALRINNPRGVLTWMWDEYDDSFQIKDGAVIDITPEQLQIGNAYHILREDKGNNSMDQADVRLNINEKGYLPMNVGDTFEINSTRVWQAVYSYLNTNTGMPEFHYTVIDPTTGKTSDILEVTPRSPYTWQADLTAKAEGTAIVLVTYDAMYDPQTMGGSKLSAIWPENTGVFVVTVGADGSAIDTGMKLNETLGFTSYKVAGEYIDAEMDVLYYREGTKGASYSFTPESGSRVTVLHPTVTTNAMTYSGGFGTEGVTVDEETGTVTLTGLTIGRHIVRVEKDGLATYQILSAKPVSYTIVDSEGDAVDENTVINAGDSITITYDGLYNPAEKQSGVYNFTSRVFLANDVGDITYNREANTMGVYTFNATNQTITVTVPESWGQEEITFTGGIATSAFGGNAGVHRVVDYDVGLGANAYNTDQYAHLCSLPAITVKVKTNDGRVEGKLILMDGETVLEGASYSLVGADGATIPINADGSFKVMPGTYTYTIIMEGYQYKSGEIEVTKDGDNQFIIPMTALSDKAWDGKTTREPAKNDDGWYLIGTAEEFIWYRNAINDGTITEYNALLTDDIDLGGQPFEPIKAFSNGNTLDGQGHSILNLYVNRTVSGYITGVGGLFNTLNGTFRNTTVEGEVIFKTKMEGAYVAAIAGYFSSDTKATEQGGYLYNIVSNVDLTVYPTKSGWGPKYGVGSMIGNTANGYSTKVPGVVERCVNNGTITVVESDTFNVCAVGGIAGVMGQRIDILDCGNNGDIIVTSSNASSNLRIGGLVGWNDGNGYKGQLRGSYNAGDITVTKPGTASVSGLMSYNSWGTINGCYNSGIITVNLTAANGSATVNGLSANGTKSKTLNCYNIGSFQCSEGVSVTNASGMNCYYLAGSNVGGDNAKAITREEFKTVNLGKYLLSTCDGYPEPYWKDAKFHTKGEEKGKLEATCLTSSATVYVCDNCGVEFAYGETDDSFGHNLCSHKTLADVEACEYCEYLEEPDCVTGGVIRRVCRNEGCDLVSVSSASAFGHSYCTHTTQSQHEANPDCPYHTYDEPICNEPGHIYRVCKVCGADYTGTAPTFYAPHTPDLSTRTEVPGEAYDQYLCADCGGTLRVYHTLDTSGEFPWVYSEENERFESTVTAPNAAKSTATLAIGAIPAGAIVSFDCGCNTGGYSWRLDYSYRLGISSGVYQTDPTSKITAHGAANELTYTFAYNRTNTSETTTGNDFAWLDNIVVHVHTMDPTNITEDNLVKEATCTEPGKIYNICPDCGMQTDVLIDSEPLGHELKTRVIQPTCTEGGYTQHSCKRDGCTYNTRDSFTEATGHSYVAVVTAPTKTEGGYTTYSCEFCGDSYVSDFTEPDDGVTVYFSASHDDKFLVGEGNGQTMALTELNVPYFDLALYGLEDYYLGENVETAAGKVTILHLVLYATEVFQYGLTEAEAGQGYLYEQNILGTKALRFSQGAGSMKIDNLWGMDLNLNYYHNYEYPLESEGWGATLDQIVLTDGDVVTLGHFTSWNFHGDPSSVFNYLNNGNNATCVSETVGKELTLSVFRAGADESGGYTTGHDPVEKELDVYYAPADDISQGDVTEWTKLGTTDENGDITFNTKTLGLGTYVLAVAGRYGDEYTTEICSTPGGIRLTVEACQEHVFEETVVEPTCMYEGYTEYTCRYCGKCFREDFTPALGHELTVVVTEPTHNKMGFTTTSCANCDYCVIDSFTDALEHTYVRTVTREATCTTEGEMTFTCECGDSYIMAIPVTGHSCEKTIVAPTCTEMGYTIYQCENCEHNYLGDLTPATGHTESVVNTKDATWHTEGYTGDTVCAVCGEELAKGKAIPALGCPSEGFADVEAKAWYHEAVDYVVANKLMNGVDSKTFQPTGTTTRSMMATLLYRMAGEPDVTGLENPFTDVPTAAWYNKAVVWAYSEGIVTGATATTFNPDGELTREQLAVMLWCYADKPEADETALNTFSDVKSLGEYAKAAMAWAVETGLINGVGNQKLEPTGSASRAQIATILMRYIQN